jgi:ribosomal protein L37AE/L43A
MFWKLKPSPMQILLESLKNKPSQRRAKPTKITPDMIIPCPECGSYEVELTGYCTWSCTKCSHEYFRPVIR